MGRDSGCCPQDRESVITFSLSPILGFQGEIPGSYLPIGERCGDG